MSEWIVDLADPTLPDGPLSARIRERSVLEAIALVREGRPPRPLTG